MRCAPGLFFCSGVQFRHGTRSNEDPSPPSPSSPPPPPPPPPLALHPHPAPPTYPTRDLRTRESEREAWRLHRQLGPMVRADGRAPELQALFRSLHAFSAPRFVRPEAYCLYAGGSSMSLPTGPVPSAAQERGESGEGLPSPGSTPSTRSRPTWVSGSTDIQRVVFDQSWASEGTVAMRCRPKLFLTWTVLCLANLVRVEPSLARRLENARRAQDEPRHETPQMSSSGAEFAPNSVWEVSLDKMGGSPGVLMGGCRGGRLGAEYAREVQGNADTCFDQVQTLVAILPASSTIGMSAQLGGGIGRLDDVGEMSGDLDHALSTLTRSGQSSPDVAPRLHAAGLQPLEI